MIKCRFLVTSGIVEKNLFMIEFNIEVMQMNLQIAVCDDEPIIANDIRKRLSV